MKIMNLFMEKARHFTIFDYGVFKLALASAGVLIGMYCSAWLMPYAPIIWGIFAISYGGLIYRIFNK